MVSPLPCLHPVEAVKTFDRKFSKISDCRSKRLNPSQTIKFLTGTGRRQIRWTTNAMSRRSPLTTGEITCRDKAHISDMSREEHFQRKGRRNKSLSGSKNGFVPSIQHRMVLPVATLSIRRLSISSSSQNSVEGTV